MGSLRTNRKRVGAGDLVRVIETVWVSEGHSIASGTIGIVLGPASDEMNRGAECLSIMWPDGILRDTLDSLVEAFDGTR